MTRAPSPCSADSSSEASAKEDATQGKPTDDADLLTQAEGRLAYLVDQGSVKSAGVIRDLLAALRASQQRCKDLDGGAYYRRTRERAEAAERERDAARAEASELRSEHVMTRLEQRVIEAERERDALREALMGLVTAVDDRIGMASLHTWKEQLAALEAARAALAPRPPCSAEATQGKPVKEE